MTPIPRIAGGFFGKPPNWETIRPSTTPPSLEGMIPIPGIPGGFIRDPGCVSPELAPFVDALVDLLLADLDGMTVQ